LEGVNGLATGPPHEEVLKYRPHLAFLSVGYGVVVVIGFAALDIADTVYYVFSFIATLQMACCAARYIGSCLMMFTLYSGWIAIMSAVNFLMILFRQHPSASELFSVSCPYNQSLKMRENETVNSVPSLRPTGPYTILGDTTVLVPTAPCSWQSVLFNVSVLLGVILSIASTTVGVKMLKAAFAALPDQMPVMEGGRSGGGQPPQPPAGGVAGSARGPSAGGSAPQPPRPNFTPFQGAGQTLSGS